VSLITSGRQLGMRAQLKRAGTPGPRAIGIDEISVRKAYRIAVSDLVRKRPIWFGGTDRSEASMAAFYDWLVSFELLYGLLILRQSRRELLWLGVTAHPNAEWLARQLNEACGWDEPPRYLIRDRDGAYGAAFIRRIRAHSRPTGLGAVA
jgi:hypothetical protein